MAPEVERARKLFSDAGCVGAVRLLDALVTKEERGRPLIQILYVFRTESGDRMIPVGEKDGISPLEWLAEAAEYLSRYDADDLGLFDMGCEDMARRVIADEAGHLS